MPFLGITAFVVRYLILFTSEQHLLYFTDNIPRLVWSRDPNSLNLQRWKL